MNTIRLTDADLMAGADVAALPGTFLYRPHYDRVVRDSTTVLKPDGTVLLIYAKDALPRTLCQQVFDTFKNVPIRRTDSRGLAAGGQSYRHQLQDGTMSRTVRWRPMKSDVLGYMDRGRRNPYCRMTTFARDHIEVLLPQFRLLLPLTGCFGN